MPTYEHVVVADDNTIPGKGGTALDARYSRNGDLLFNVKKHGVKGDGVTNDTAAIQALIDAGNTAGGRTLYFPAGTYLISNLILKGNVILLGSQPVYGYGPSGKGSTHIRPISGGTGIMIDVTGANAGVMQMNIFGNHNGTTGVTTGIRSTDSWCRFSELSFNAFGGPAIQTIGSGYATVIDNVLAINCCMDRTATADVGVMDIAGNDHYITRVEASASLSTGVSSANLYINAWVIRGTNIFVSNTVGEFADRGYLVTGNKNRFTGARGDRNMGIGYEIRGGANAFSAAMAVDNSRGLTNTYPAFKTSGAGNTFVGCVSSYLNTELPTYAFEDTVNTGDAAARNSYYGCRGHGAQGVFKGEAYLGSSFEVPNHAVRVSGNPTVPSVAQSSFLVLHTYTAATTITDFSGGHSGQTIRLLGSTNVTIQNGTTIKTKSKANVVTDPNTIYTFTNYNGAWYEG